MDQRTRYYVLTQYYLRNGTQIGRVHDYVKGGLIPALERTHLGPAIVLEALAAPHMPQVATIVGVNSLEQVRQVETLAQSDTVLAKALSAWEQGSEPPTEHYTTTLLEAAPYSPEIAPLKEPPATPRIFELRVYHSPSEWQLAKLHERFSGAEIRIFHRVGVNPLLYTSTLLGANKPNLTYLIPFENLAAREKAWNAFGADPEWLKVRQESIDRSGQISAVMQISLYKAAPYSPIR
jgi:hypothetical protein